MDPTTFRNEMGTKKAEQYIMRYLLLGIGLVALIFLIYSLTHLEKLKIPITHPRIIVELILFLLFTLWGILFRA